MEDDVNELQRGILDTIIFFEKLGERQRAAMQGEEAKTMPAYLRWLEGCAFGFELASEYMRNAFKMERRFPENMQAQIDTERELSNGDERERR